MSDSNSIFIECFGLEKDAQCSSSNLTKFKETPRNLAIWKQFEEVAVFAVLSKIPQWQFQDSSMPDAEL